MQATKAKIYSLDGNLWHLSHEGGALEDPWHEPPEDAYEPDRPPEQAPDTPAYVTLGFEEGWPVSLDGSDWTGGARAERSTPSAASTASAASTCWRTGWSG